MAKLIYDVCFLQFYNGALINFQNTKSEKLKEATWYVLDDGVDSEKGRRGSTLEGFCAHIL